MLAARDFSTITGLDLIAPMEQRWSACTRMKSMKILEDKGHRKYTRATEESREEIIP